MRDPNQQLDQIVGDLPFPLPAQSRQERVADFGRVTPQLARRFACRALPVVRDQLERAVRMSASTMSDRNQKIYKQIEEWRQQPLVGDFPYVFWMACG